MTVCDRVTVARAALSKHLLRLVEDVPSQHYDADVSAILRRHESIWSGGGYTDDKYFVVITNVAPALLKYISISVF